MRKRNSNSDYYGYAPSQYYTQNAKKKTVSGRHIIIAICAVVFVVCAVMLISYAIDAAKTKNLNDMASDIIFITPTPDIEETVVENVVVPEATPAPLIAEAVATAVPQESTENQTVPVTSYNPYAPWPDTYPNNASLRISSAFYELRNKYNNDDICAYLEIENVVSAQPVVQKDNSFYLTHSVDKKQNQNGTLFIDEACNLNTVPAQIIVYGHNMKDGLAFGPLKKYATKNASFFQDNPFITFNTIYENGRYVIFAIIDDLDIRSGQPNYLPFWFYSDFSDVDEFNDYIIKAKSLSKIHCNVDVEPGDRLLVLSTCVGTNEYQKNLRFVIIARRIREGETEFDLEQKILTSIDR